MNKLFRFFCLLSLLSISTLTEAKHAKSHDDLPPQDQSAPVASTWVKRTTLKQMSGVEAMNLNGLKSSETVTFGEQSDALVTQAVLHLKYTFSPSLLPGDTHLKISINDQVIHVLPLTKESLGKTMQQTIEIDPRLISNLTRVRFQFIGHYTHDCEDPFYTSLWMELAGDSYFELTMRSLELKNELSLLPEPFFNTRDFSSQLSVPFIFSSAPGRDSLNAAGIVSSWFGKLAAWRGASFPVKLDTLPAGHAIVFASNDDRPDFLKHYPKITGPTLEVTTNPVDGHSKLLLILGQNGEELKVAARALALGYAGLTGNRTVVRGTQPEVPREPYDAPNWVRMDRPMKFGEFIVSPQELQASGYSPLPLHFALRIPPDLFTWRSRGVPIDLKYRYTPPLTLSEARLRMSINDELVKSINLLPSGDVEKSRIRLPLIDDMIMGQSEEILLPTFKLGARNEMQFQFTSPAKKSGACSDFTPENVRAMIDSDSKIDFSGFPHYAEMPNLNFFASSGYPFTKFADLSETVVVMPDHPTIHDIGTMLALLARMGESTGYPATQFKVAYAKEEGRMKGADLLVIGVSLQQGLLSKWSERLPLVIRDGVLSNSQPRRNPSFLFNWFNFETKPDTDVRSGQQLEQNGAVAALLGFESPLSSKRSVVAVVASQAEHLTLALDALQRANGEIQGSAVLIHPNKIEAMLVGHTYVVGNLPFWMAIWYGFANHPVMLGILGVLSLLIFSFALWRTLRVIAAKRLRIKKQG